MLATAQPNSPCTGSNITPGNPMDAALDSMTTKVNAAITHP